MNPQQLKINPPEGFEIDQEKSDLSKGIVYFKGIKKSLTYEYISKSLFEYKSSYYIEASGNINQITPTFNIIKPNNSPTREQLKSILALNMLCNVAKYLNGDWLPQGKKGVFYIYIPIDENKLCVSSHIIPCTSVVYFKTSELAQQAIKILGEETIRKTLILNH